jgi:hypothetical protein
MSRVTEIFYCETNGQAVTVRITASSFRTAHYHDCGDPCCPLLSEKPKREEYEELNLDIERWGDLESDDENY